MKAFLDYTLSLYKENPANYVYNVYSTGIVLIINTKTCQNGIFPTTPYEKKIETYISMFNCTGLTFSKIIEKLNCWRFK